MIAACLYFPACNNTSTSKSAGDSTVSKSGADTAVGRETAASVRSTIANQASIDFATKAANGGIAELAVGKSQRKKPQASGIKILLP